MIDVFITTKPGREELTQKSLRSFIDNTTCSYRLTLYVDGKNHGLMNSDEFSHANYIITSNENEGLAPAINRCMSHISATNAFYADKQVPDYTQVSEFVVMLQDDLEYTKAWLDRLSRLFLFFEDKHKIGFASGLECVEHPTKAVIAGGILLKQWIRASCMFARREYWESMMPIPRWDPETRNIRAKPNNGMGSGVDWWLIRNHENSVDRSGRTCLVQPGLVRHIGYKNSTWLKRDLPESDEDKMLMGK